MNTNHSLIEALAKSDIVRNYEKAFGDTTGQPIALVPRDGWKSAFHGKRHENPFCALMSKSNKTCAGCLQMQESIKQRAEEKTCTETCQYGLVETAAPVRLGHETIGFLVTGQVMRDKPTAAHFNRVADRIEKDGGEIDRDKARAAYLATPAVSKRSLDSVAQLLSIFAEHLAMQSNQLAVQASNTEPSVVTKAREFIDANIQEEVSLAETARAAGASTFHLCKLFRRHLGMTFTEYVARRRVEKAKEMLLKPNMRISEVAFDVGFQSLTHFNRVFRKIVGGSPTEFRSHLAVAA